MLSTIVKNTPARAKIVRWNNAPCLIASFSLSTPPMVWQFDLEKLTNYSIHVVEKDGAWDLGYTSPQTGFSPIAHFDERMEAEQAYSAVQCALMKGAHSASGLSFAWVPRVLLWGCVFVVAAFLISLVVSLNEPKELPKDLAALAAGRSERSAATGAPASNAEDVINMTPRPIQNGVPVSADDVLPKD